MTDSELVVRDDDLDWSEYDPDEGHAFRRKQLGAASGSEGLGASRYSVEPGQSVWHRHYHTANEEALYVLDGGGTVELGTEREAVDLRPGTYVAFPADERGTHAIEAGEDGLEMLVFSTMNEPDVTVYPDEEMVGLYVGSPPGGDREERSLSKYVDLDGEREYWE